MKAQFLAILFLFSLISFQSVLANELNAEAMAGANLELPTVADLEPEAPNFVQPNHAAQRTCGYFCQLGRERRVHQDYIVCFRRAESRGSVRSEQRRTVQARCRAEAEARN